MSGVVYAEQVITLCFQNYYGVWVMKGSERGGKGLNNSKWLEWVGKVSKIR